MYSMQHVIEAVETLTQREGYPPTVSELARYLGIVKSDVQYHVDHAVEKGLLTREPHKARTLRVVRTQVLLVESAEEGIIPVAENV